MRFSLILATYGDARDLPRFLNGLRQQAMSDVELIVVDQNSDDHVAALLAQWRSELLIRHVRAAPGLSSARNVGIGLAQGDILAFPDDDCWYPGGLLRAVERILEDPGIDGVTCRCTDAFGRLAAGAEDRRSGRVTKRNVWGRGVSATMFVKRETVDSVGTFDESLGLGSRTAFQSGEETDYLLRCLRGGHVIEYCADLAVHHPLPPDCRRLDAVTKSLSYGLGMGRVLRMHYYSQLDVARYVSIPMLGAVCAMMHGNEGLAKVRIARAMGRYQGWRWRPSRSVTPGGPFG